MKKERSLKEWQKDLAWAIKEKKEFNDIFENMINTFKKNIKDLNKQTKGK